MSWQPSEDPVAGDRRSCDALDIVIVPRVRDLGGFNVRRALPSAKRQMVGPFIFWYQMGPAEFPVGEGIDVRPQASVFTPPIMKCAAGLIGARSAARSRP